MHDVGWIMHEPGSDFQPLTHVPPWTSRTKADFSVCLNTLMSQCISLLNGGKGEGSCAPQGIKRASRPLQRRASRKTRGVTAGCCQSFICQKWAVKDELTANNAGENHVMKHPPNDNHWSALISASRTFRKEKPSSLSDLTLSAVRTVADSNETQLRTVMVCYIQALFLVIFTHVDRKHTGFNWNVPTTAARIAQASLRVRLNAAQ